MKFDLSPRADSSRHSPLARCILQIMLRGFPLQNLVYPPRGNDRGDLYCRLISGCRHFRHTPRRSVRCSLCAYFYSRPCAFGLTVILHLRHGARIVLRVTTLPGYDSYSWLTLASSSFCSWLSRSYPQHPRCLLCGVDRTPIAMYIHNVNLLIGERFATLWL